MNLEAQWPWLLPAAAVAIVGIVIWNVMLTVRASRLKKMLRRWTGDIELSAFDDTISAIQAEQKRQHEQQQQLQLSVRQIADQLQGMKGHVGMIRYDAFAEGGSGLSFSIAMVDEHRNGVVLSGIRNRESTHMYAKPLTEGSSAYPLTPEEREAIRQALQQSPERPTS